MRRVRKIVSDPVSFRFQEFILDHAQRGVAAARVLVVYGPADDGDNQLVWMDQDDLEANLRAFPGNTELTKAQNAYYLYAKN